MDALLHEFLDAVDSWAMLRKEFTGSKASDLNGFVTSMNHHTRKLISILDRQDDNWWDALAEMATHASTVVTPGANVFVNKQHHTKF